MGTLDIERIERSLCADSRYRVGNFFLIGFLAPALTSSDIYVTLVPLPGLAAATPGELKNLRREFSQFYGATFLADIALGDERALRFAKFFGFRESHRSATRIHCVKEC